MKSEPEKRDAKDAKGKKKPRIRRLQFPPMANEDGEITDESIERFAKEAADIIRRAAEEQESSKSE